MIDYIEKIQDIILTYLDEKSKLNKIGYYVSSIVKNNNDKILMLIKDILDKYPTFQLSNASNFIYGDSRCWKIYIDSHKLNNNIYVLLISVFGYFTIMEEKK